MHTIVVTGRKFEGTLLFKVDGDGIVREFTSESEFNDAQLDWLSKNFPTTLEKLNQMISAGLVEGKLIEYDLSFSTFWEAYGNSAGKLQAERFWNKLSKADKIRALDNLPAYKRYVTFKGIDMMYAATYLNPRNRRFDDDYKALIKSR